MLSKFGLMSLTAALFFAGCTTQAPSAVKPQPTKTQPVMQVIPDHGTFQGTLPCADCEGIKTELTLVRNVTTGAQTYSLRETYLGRNKNQPFVSGGTWEILPGQIIYQLNPAPVGKSDKPTPQWYLLKDPMHLQMLDADKKPIVATGLNFTLTLVPTPISPTTN